MVHIKRTVDGVMGRYIEAMEKCKNVIAHVPGIIKRRTDHYNDLVNSADLVPWPSHSINQNFFDAYEANVASIIANRALMKIGSEK